MSKVHGIKGDKARRSEYSQGRSLSKATVKNASITGEASPVLVSNQAVLFGPIDWSRS